MTRRAGCQKATTELSLQNSQSLSHLCYPMDTRQLTSPQGEADGVSDGGMMLQALGGVNLPCGWYRVRGQLPSTGGQEHTHTHTHTHILAQWRCPVASSKGLDLLHWAMCAVLYRHTTAAINMAIFLGVFVDCCLFACCSGGRWGNMEQVVARCWRSVASGVALDMPHQAMPSVLLWRTAVAIKTAGG